MNPKQFLMIVGGVLVFSAALGFFGIIGPTPEASVFGLNWWFDNVENWAHLVVGIAALIAAFTLPVKMERSLLAIFGIIGIMIGLWSLIISTSFFGAHLENPTDSALHLALGALALWVAHKKKTPEISMQ